MPASVEVTLGDNYKHFVAGSSEGIGNYAIIRNATWWIDNVEQIDNWLDEMGMRTRYKHEGMVLTFEHSEDLALFLLRWS